MKANMAKLMHFISYRAVLTVLMLTFTVVPSLATFFIAKNYVNNTISNSYTDE